MGSTTVTLNMHTDSLVRIILAALILFVESPLSQTSNNHPGRMEWEEWSPWTYSEDGKKTRTRKEIFIDNDKDRKSLSVSDIVDIKLVYTDIRKELFQN